MTTKRVSKSEDYDVFVGRGRNGSFDIAKAVKERTFDEKGWLGNPYKMQDYTRSKAIALFERDLEIILDTKPWFKWKLVDLYGKDLACYCEPHQDCHGDVIVRKVNELYWDIKRNEQG